MRNVLLILGICIAAAGCSPESREAQRAVKSLLKDPDSAKFREVSVIASNVVCGEVNAKNGMGGYGGYTPFMFRDGAVSFGDDPDSSVAISLCCATIAGHMTTPDRPGFTETDIMTECGHIERTPVYLGPATLF